MRETLVKTEEFEDSQVEKIPNAWEIVSLKNEINILHGYAFKGEYFADEPPGDVLLVPGNFHRDGGLYFDENNTKYYRGLIPDGTVLENEELLIVMTDLSPRTLILGRVVLLELPFRVLHNQRIGKIFLKLPDTWDKRFLLLVMNSDRVRRNIISNATGTTVRHTSPDRIIANVVPKPLVEEQSKIADILDTIDAAIAHTSSLIAKLKQMKAGLLHDLLTRGLDENGELRDAIAHPEQFKDSPLGQVPKEWEVLTLSEVGTWLSGGTPNKGVSAYWNGKIPWVSPKDMKQLYLEDTINHITDTGANAGTRIVSPGTVFIVVRGMILAHSFPIGIALREMAFNQDIKAVTRSETVLFLYLAYWLMANSFNLLRLVTESTHGTKRFDLKDLLSYQIAIPSRSEQKQIIKILDTYDTRIRSEEAYREKLKLQKQGLMHDLLTGKVLVKDADKSTSVIELAAISSIN